MSSSGKRTALRLLGIGWYVALCIAGGAIGGWWLDQRLELSPVLTLTGLGLGIAIAVVGMILYHEPVDHWTLLGALVIFSGIFLNVHAENRNSLATESRHSRQ